MATKFGADCVENYCESVTHVVAARYIEKLKESLLEFRVNSLGFVLIRVLTWKCGSGPTPRNAARQSEEENLSSLDFGTVSFFLAKLVLNVE